MFYRFFGLSGPPFEFGSSPTNIFMSTPHREALAALEWGVAHETSGFTLLVGETGTGKTTLVKALLAQHHERVRAAYVLNPRLRIEEIMNLVLEQLKVKEVPSDRLGLWREIEKTITQLEDGERIVVIVDDAQDLNDECLEDLRLLSNCEANGNKRMHFILVSQPELLTRLRTQKLRNINQRIGARATLNPLNSDEARSYVDYRLRQKGGSAPKIFTNSALRLLIKHSNGIPRQINLLCNSAMLAAYADGTGVVTATAARAAVNEYRNLHGILRTTSVRFGSFDLVQQARPWAIALVTGASVAAAAVLYMVLSGGPRAPQAQPVETNEAVSAAPDSGGEALSAMPSPAAPIARAPAQTVSIASPPVSLTPPPLPKPVPPPAAAVPPATAAAPSTAPAPSTAAAAPADALSNVRPPADAASDSPKGFGVGRSDSVEGLKNSYFGFEVEPGEISNGSELAGEPNPTAPVASAPSTTNHGTTAKHHRKHAKRRPSHRNYDQADDNAAPTEPANPE